MMKSRIRAVLRFIGISLALCLCACAPDGAEVTPVPDDGTAVRPAADTVSIPADPLEFSDEAGLRQFLTGTWEYRVPGEDAPAAAVALNGDGTFRAVPDMEDGTAYEGAWRLERLYADSAAPPDLLCLDLPAGSLGEYCLIRRTLCGGTYMMRWDLAGDGDSLFSRYGVSSPVMSRPAEAAAAAEPLRREARFYAVCWKVEDDGGGGITLWLDDTRPDNFEENAGERQAVPYALSPEADLRCSPDVFAAGGYVADVETDAAGAVIMLNWASPGSGEAPPDEEARLLFDKEDPMIDGLSLGMTMDQAMEVFPKPEGVLESDADESPYGASTACRYDGMTLHFYDLYGEDRMTLGSVFVDGENIRLANGLRPGFTAEEVLASWYDDGRERTLGGADPWGVMLYGDYLFSGEAPSGYEQSALRTLPGEDGSYFITYCCYTPVGDALEEVDLTFYIDAEDTVTGIHWGRALLK